MTKEASYTPDAQIEWLKQRLAYLQLPGSKHDHDTREKFLLGCGMPPEDPKRAAAPEMFEALQQHEAFLERLIAMVSGGSDMSPASIAISMNALLEMSSAALAKAKGE